MKSAALMFALACYACAQNTDLDRLQGTWTIVSLTFDGQATPEAQLRASRFVIEGQKFTSSGLGDPYAGTIDVNPAASPRTLDIHFTEGPEKGNTTLAIYEFDGGRWRLCLDLNGGRRPPKFAAEAKSGFVLEILERVANSDLEGEWSMVSGTFDGQPLPAAYVSMGKRVVKGSEMTVTFGTELYSKSTFTLDPAKSPNAIDVQNTAGTNAGKTQYGIYERKGDTLKLSLAAPGRDRPTDFTTTPGDGRTVVVWQK